MASRPDIMFAVSKGQTQTGLWYPRVSSFDLEAYSNSDYAGANLDMKSTIGGCQFLGSVKLHSHALLYITAKVAGKPVSISEASIRSDLLFYDADGIDSLPNQAIFDAIQLMGYEEDLTGKHFSGKVTPLFASMLVQPTEDEGATSERPSEPQPTPSPPHPSEAN
ncbi:hypothetical protein Tco_0236586 [Tanacetum coccineum]